MMCRTGWCAIGVHKCSFQLNNICKEFISGKFLFLIQALAEKQMMISQLEAIEAQKLDNEGSKLGYMMLSEMVEDIQKVGLERFNQALKSIGYKGEEVTLEDW